MVGIEAQAFLINDHGVKQPRSIQFISCQTLRLFGFCLCIGRCCQTWSIPMPIPYRRRDEIALSALPSLRDGKAHVIRSEAL